MLVTPKGTKKSNKKTQTQELTFSQVYNSIIEEDDTSSDIK